MSAPESREAARGVEARELLGVVGPGVGVRRMRGDAECAPGELGPVYLEITTGGTPWSSSMVARALLRSSERRELAAILAPGEPDPAEATRAALARALVELVAWHRDVEEGRQDYPHPIAGPVLTVCDLARHLSALEAGERAKA